MDFLYIAKEKISQEKWGEAIPFLQSTLYEDPTYQEALILLGIAFLENKEMEKGNKTLNFARKQNPLDPALQEAYGVYHFKQGLYEEALGDLTLASSLDPQSSSILKNLGVVHLKLNHAEEALRLLKEAYKINPEDYKIGYALASAFAENGRLKESAKMLESLLAGQLPEDFKQLTLEHLQYFKSLGII